MKVKAVSSEEKITLSELRAILATVEADRIAAGKEMPWELRRSIEHVNLLAKTTPEQSRELVEDLLRLDKMRPEIALRIANINPRTRDELRAIYAKEKFSLTGEDLDAILNLVNSHV
ncbi:MAG: RNA polymerase Rpb4 family protein [Methanomicrobiales archaeon]|nr:RNA polymerase Rpb4 family protein [Methanomicrobiales archaeon]